MTDPRGLGGRVSPARAYAAALVLLTAGLVLLVVAYGLPWLTLAVVLGIVATRGWGRTVASLLLGAAGLVAAVTGIVLVLNGGDDSGSPLGALGGLLVAFAGGWATWRGRAWPAMGGRYERTSTVATASSSRLAAWDALDRGQDPTDDLVE